jgi:hypothetical protein
MKRFIDLRGQGTGSLFAWYDTVRDEFKRFSYGSQDWSSWREFVHDFSDHYWKRHPGPDRGSKEDFEAKLQRYKSLLPDWVPKTTPSEEEFDRIDKSRKG